MDEPPATGNVRGRTALAPFVESLRPYQWLKNLLVFVPLAAAHRLDDTRLLIAAARCFAAFSLCASAVYLLNDLHDAAADRTHPNNKHRPIASGRLAPWHAALIVPVLLGGSAALAWPAQARTLESLALYLALMIAYTWALKRIVLLDALVLAGGYALRVIAGGYAVSIQPSSRLWAFCIFLFFSLALVKRYGELCLLLPRDGPATHARGYRLEDQGFIVSLGLSCGALSVLVLANYMSSEKVALLYTRSQFIWLTSILLLYWISHLWLTVHRGQMLGDPLLFAIRNRTSRILVLSMAASAWLAV